LIHLGFPGVLGAFGGASWFFFEISWDFLGFLGGWSFGGFGTQEKPRKLQENTDKPPKIPEIS
jgi:hypothetical protein